MEYKIVIGGLFGDEGKGVTTQWLAQKAYNENKVPLVIRYSGGSQAGHTCANDNNYHIFSNIGSGALVGADTLLSNNFLFDPVAFVNEYKDIQKLGVCPKVYIDSNVRIITPYDIINGRQDSKIKLDGTCGRGIFPTFKRYNSIYSYDEYGYNRATSIIHLLFNDDLSYRDYERVKFLKETAKYYKMPLLSEDPKTKIYQDDFINALDVLTYFEKEKYIEFVDSHSNFKDIIKKYNTLIFEGSQGLLLDMESGFMPNCTPSKVGINGVIDFFKEYHFSEKGITKFENNNFEVYLPIRTYLTRHGNGYRPMGSQEIYPYIKDIPETNIFNDWQGTFKVGIFNFNLLVRAFDRARLNNYQNCKYNLVVNHTDILKFYQYDKDRKEFMYIDKNNQKMYITPLHDDTENWEMEDFTERWLDIVSDNTSKLGIQNIYYNDSIKSDIKKF